VGVLAPIPLHMPMDPTVFSHSVNNLFNRLKELIITESQLPYTFETGVSVDTFNQLLQREHRFHGMLELENSSILIVELPSEPHEQAHEQLHMAIYPALQPHGLVAKGATTIASNIVGNTSLEGDRSYRPNLPPPAGITRTNWVTLVIEVTRSAALLRTQHKALRWITETSCREVIVISFSPQGQSLRAFVYRQGAAANPVQAVQFGNAHCLALGQVVLQIQLASIFGGAANIPVAVAGNPAYVGGMFPIDLFPVKTAILNALQ